ncbi:MAG: hypothetical protein DMG30_02010 [Acidobacteria bacterium]|nr:MAG: hypothetical protein DMG30_02010 [Acidobacteriota bacterium]
MHIGKGAGKGIGQIGKVGHAVEQLYVSSNLSKYLGTTAFSAFGPFCPCARRLSSLAPCCVFSFVNPTPLRSVRSHPASKPAKGAGRKSAR